MVYETLGSVSFKVTSVFFPSQNLCHLIFSPNIVSASTLSDRDGICHKHKLSLLSLEALAISNSTLYAGVWINHDYSSAIGATLTLPIRWGNYLIAALSSLISFAATSAWEILTFYLHQRYAFESPPDKDILDQQLQILFRSQSSTWFTLADNFLLLLA
jgi:hypothetical protein